MKNPFTFRALVYFTLLVFLFQACEQELFFKEPQPRSDRDEHRFKSRYQGDYLCLEDSSILTISEKGMSREWNYEVRMTEEQVDTSPGIAIKDGRVISELNLDAVSLRYEGDTAVMTWTRRRSEFFISKEHVLRYFKGHYFLNRKRTESSWTVQTMQLDKEGKLTIKEIFVNDDAIASMKSFTEVEEETDEEGKLNETSVKPTKREMKDILKADVFKETETFQKIKIKK